MKILTKMKLFFSKGFGRFMVKLLLLLPLVFFFCTLGLKLKHNFEKRYNTLSTRALSNGEEKNSVTEVEIYAIKNKINELKEEIRALESSFTRIQNENPIINSNNIKTIITLWKLQEKIMNCEYFENCIHDYTQEIKLLKFLTKNNEKLYDLSLQLENSINSYYDKKKYINKGGILNVFLSEMNTFLQSENVKSSNKLKKLFVDNITIRKIRNFTAEEKDSLDYKLYSLESSIKRREFEVPIALIKEYGYEKDFPNTLKLVEIQYNISVLCDGMLNSVYGE